MRDFCSLLVLRNFPHLHALSKITNTGLAVAPAAPMGASHQAVWTCACPRLSPAPSPGELKLPKLQPWMPTQCPYASPGAPAPASISCRLAFNVQVVSGAPWASSTAPSLRVSHQSLLGCKHEVEQIILLLAWVRTMSWVPSRDLLGGLDPAVVSLQQIWGWLIVSPRRAELPNKGLLQVV